VLLSPARSFYNVCSAESSLRQRLCRSSRENRGNCNARARVSWSIEGQLLCTWIISWQICGVRKGNGEGAFQFAHLTAPAYPSKKPSFLCS
jgi:hypothetical protein